MTARAGGAARNRKGGGETPIRYNNWHEINAPSPASYAPGTPVSVIVPYFSRPVELSRTLAALEGQTWPRDLFEVVVVDDGSPEPLEPPASTPLNVKVVRQENRGFGAARARNAGVRAAAHDVLLFLDADMMPEKGWLAAHARWHDAVPNALTLGLRAHVDADGLDVEEVRNRVGTLTELFVWRKTERVWIELHLDQRNDLATTSDDEFQIVVSGNLGVRREFFDRIGEFNESLAQWGGEDVEFGYRAFARGGLLIPVRGGFAWHQGLFSERRQEKEKSLQLNMAKFAHTIAHPMFRTGVSGRTFTVPRFVVTMRVDGVSAEHVFAAAVRVLSGPVHDLVLRLDLSENYPERELLHRHFDPDPRVRVAPPQHVLDEFPTSQFHVELPASTHVNIDTIGSLQAALGDAVVGRGKLRDGTLASITRIWALHRARSTPWDAAAFGDAVRIPLPEDGPESSPKKSLPKRRVRAHLKSEIGRSWRRLKAELRQIGGPASAGRFIWWLSGAAMRRVRRPLGSVRVGAPPMAGCNSPAVRIAPRAEDPPLGVEIAVLGNWSRGVFRASERVARTLDGRHLDVAVADTAALGAEAARAGIPVVALDEAPPMLSVPAFDPWVDNPIGIRRTAERTIGALGRMRFLPPGRNADRRADVADRAALRAMHHVEDMEVFHADVAERAGTLVRLAAMGAVVHLADGGGELKDYLGEELFELMSREVRSLGTDDRQALSVAMRRAALRDHSLTSRARQVAERVLADPPRLPLVSVLMATRHPEMLVSALASVRQQTYPRLELILSLHGEEFGDVPFGAMRADIPMTVLRPDPGLPLGSVLNGAVEASRGTLLTKMDVGDLYGPDHVWDLVLAWETSKAPLVGKGDEFVYRSGSNQIACALSDASESYQTSGGVAGGALLIERRELERVGGWPRFHGTGTDQALVQNVQEGGTNRVYRTHPFGYLPVHHGKGHSCAKDDSGLLARGARVIDGQTPGLPGVDGARLNQLVTEGHAALAGRIYRGLRAHARGTGCMKSLSGLAEQLVATAPTEVHRSVASALQEALVRDAFEDSLRMARTISRKPDLCAEKVVSHKFRCLWLCVPKVASRSIKAQLVEFDPDARVIEKKTLAEVYLMHPEARGYFTFAFVRDPCERAFSFFAEKYVQSSDNKREWFVEPFYGASPTFSFDDLCQWLNTPWGSDAFADPHWLSQSRQLMLEEGRLPDFIGQYENLEAHWRIVCERLGMPDRSLPKLNVTAERELDEDGLYRAEDLPKDALIARNESLLRERYAEDFTLTGQRPEGWGGPLDPGPRSRAVRN